ncbi:MAG: helix-turn-helix domain-containing protein [Magnetovibrionaceae bacterium]
MEQLLNRQNAYSDNLAADGGMVPTREGLIHLLNTLDDDTDCLEAFAEVMRKRARERVRLTPRQRQVLDLLVAGKANKEIARDLNLSEPTVKIHLSAVMTALGARNRTHAAVKAARLGFGDTVGMVAA